MGQRMVLVASIAAGVSTAFLVLSVAILPQVVGMLLAPLPLMMVGLWRGAGPVIVAALVAVMVLAAQLDLGGALTISALMIVPPMALMLAIAQPQMTAYGLIGRRNLGEAISWLCCAGLVGMFSLGVVMADDRGGFPAAVERVAALVSKQLVDIMGTAVGQEDSVRALVLAGVPGLVTAGWVVILVADLLLAQALVRRLGGRSWRPPIQMSEIDLPNWMAPPLLIAIFAAFASPTSVGWYGYHAAVILGSAYFLAGLSVIHVWAKGSARGAILVCVYLLVTLFSPATVVLAGLGFLEHWVRLKSRVNRVGHGDGE